MPNRPKPRSGWSTAKNERRCQLIDKRIQNQISSEELGELDALTAELRVHFDTEEYLPMKGARNLLRRLEAMYEKKGKEESAD